MLKRKTTTSRLQTKSAPPPRSNNMDYSDIADRVKPVGTVKKPLRVVLYGRAGTGKTTLAASFPKPLLIDFPNEQGTDSVSDVKGLDVIRVDTWDDFEQTYWYLASGKHKHESFIVDTVTQLQALAVNEVLASLKKSTENAGGFGTLRKQDWGQVSTLLGTWVMNYRNLPLNCVFIAQDKVFNMGEDNDDGADELRPEVGPRLMPSVSSTMNAAVDLIGNTFIRGRTKTIKKGGKLVDEEIKEFCLRVGPHSLYMTKVRSPKDAKKPAFLVDPTFEELLELGKGEI